MSIEECVAAADRLRATTPTLDELLDRLRATPEPTLAPWPPPAPDPLPAPRPIPGHPGWAIIDGLGPPPPAEQRHRPANPQHIASDRPHNLDVVGDDAGESTRKDTPNGKKY